MRVKLLKKWNRMTNDLYSCGATWNMNFFQLLYFLILKHTETHQMINDAVAEFNEYFYYYHYLNYHIGPQVMLWHLHKDNKEMHDGRRNLWSKFAHKYRKHSRKYWTAESIIMRDIKGED